MDCECGRAVQPVLRQLCSDGRSAGRELPGQRLLRSPLRDVGSTDDNLYALAGAPVCMATTPVPTVPAPTPTPLPDHPRIAEVQSPVLAGAEFLHHQGQRLYQGLRDQLLR